ncbi:PAS domain-containing sensor histidine kinase [Flectobacillus roseus]|jgi:signal transduction histidine kinase|uniref:histidine kinase n=1 Tax=Flectobacillus roseus TaxID=502259 RepID=A0ABT6YCQ4_9BACT|nr:histidine kinase dimerization/phospho-acceptor domain-containing protein [Flectobacillus roseus]MDI9861359.1 histidine kinase dimerization/phospho-acceptor domain-containing protein [Flectobacillus roseus]MDI9870959.1 histidine kinase dimerization/phospho-acceptor domain-containing protein [Flectobacillus roseus]NBA76193.1 PAS domain-containing protein [Emticicia sp. ODNR4P]
MLNPTLKDAILEALLTHLNVFVSIYNYETDEVVLVNQSGLELFKVRDEKEFTEKYGIEVRETPITSEQNAKLRKSLEEGAQWSEEVQCKVHDGTTFWAIINIDTFQYNSQTYLITRIINLEKLLQFEKENGIKGREYFKNQIDQVISYRTAALLETLTKLERSQYELSEALHREHRLNELKSQFITFASHEFRTPLGIISSSANLLSKYNKIGNVQKQEEHIQSILENVKTLTALLEESLSMSKLDENSIDRPLNFYLSKIMQEIKESL